jgi:hypothetical protein
MMLGDGGVDEVSPLPRHPGVSALLVDPHEAAVAGDVAGENRREPARMTTGRKEAVLVAATELTNFTRHGLQIAISARPKHRHRHDLPPRLVAGEERSAHAKRLAEKKVHRRRAPSLAQEA